MAKRQKDLEALNEMRAIFSDVDAGLVGFFINPVKETRSCTHVRLYVVQENRPRDVTATVIKATGVGAKNGNIVLGGWGMNRFLTLMYNVIGFTLHAGTDTDPLKWAHKYYREVL